MKIKFEFNFETIKLITNNIISLSDILNQFGKYLVFILIILKKKLFFNTKIIYTKN